jgi:predicted dehydrogenase
MSERLRVGLVGAGPWAQLFTAPMLAGSDDADLVGIWARRPEAAEELAARHGTEAVADLDELIGRSDALCFSVPPSVQAELGARAARAGRALLLDKPVGATAGEAEALAAAVDEAGVVTQVIFTYRYLDATRAFLAEASAIDTYGGRASFYGNGSLAGTYFATPWRLTEGGLLDLGPHALDLLDAALGPIESIEAHGDPHRVVLLECAHAGGRVSQAALCATTDAPGGLTAEVVGRAGMASLDLVHRPPEAAARAGAVAQVRIVAELAECVRTGRPHALDVHHGLRLQRLIDAAAAQLRR